MLLATLSLLSLGQTVPDSASILYPMFPTSSSNAISMPTHSASFKLGKESISFESLSTMRNTSDKPVTMTLDVPVLGRQVTWKQFQGERVSVQVNRQSVALKVGQTNRTEPTGDAAKNKAWAGLYTRKYSVSLTFKPKETKSLMVKFSAPIGRAGLDGVQRMVAYNVLGARSWAGGVGQLNVAIQDPDRLVLQVFAALPDGTWQIGTRGAFWKQANFMPGPKPDLIFTYYPNTFERIGGGGDPSEPPR
jgi:hypothetical protein